MKLYNVIAQFLSKGTLYGLAGWFGTVLVGIDGVPLPDGPLTQAIAALVLAGLVGVGKRLLTWSDYKAQAC